MYSIVDIEGNGGPYRQECIIEIAIYRFDGHRIVDQFSSLIHPEAEISPYVVKLTGITPKMVKTAPKFHEVARRVLEITEGSTLVGHNVDFDYRMLRQAFARLGYTFKIPTLDTIPIAKKLIPNAEGYALGKICSELGIPLPAAHRAGDDARATVELFRILMAKDRTNEIISQQYEETNAKTFANKVKELTQDLPAQKGIIYFQNAHGEIIFSEYVQDIQKSAKKIFTLKGQKYAAVHAHTEQITYDLVGNEMVAMLMLAAKGMSQKLRFPFALLRQEEGWQVKKAAKNEGEVVMRLKSFSQGQKIIKGLQQYPEEMEARLQQVADFASFTGLLSLPGRQLGEKTFLRMEKGKVRSFGFYQYFTQIASREMLSKLEVTLDRIPAGLDDAIKLLLLQGDVTYPQE